MDTFNTPYAPEPDARDDQDDARCYLMASAARAVALAELRADARRAMAKAKLSVTSQAAEDYLATVYDGYAVHPPTPPPGSLFNEDNSLASACSEAHSLEPVSEVDDEDEDLSTVDSPLGELGDNLFSRMFAG